MENGIFEDFFLSIDLCRSSSLGSFPKCQPVHGFSTGHCILHFAAVLLSKVRKSGVHEVVRAIFVTHDLFEKKSSFSYSEEL